MDNPIKTIRKQRGLTLADVAQHVGVGPSQVSKWETGDVDIPSSKIIKLAEVLGVSVGHLLGVENAEPSNAQWRESLGVKPWPAPWPKADKPSPRSGSDELSTTEPIRRDFPIYGTALGGALEIEGQPIEQTTLNRAEVIHYIRRPAILLNNNEAYGLYVAGSSMEPRYFDGEFIPVDPKGRVKAGEDVVVYLRTKDQHDDDGEHARAALVKRLLRRASTYIELEQYSPAKVFRVEIEEVLRIDRIIPVGELLGA